MATANTGNVECVKSDAEMATWEESLWGRTLMLSDRQQALILVQLFGHYSAYMTGPMRRFYPQDAAECQTFMRQLEKGLDEAEKEASHG